MLPTIVVDNFFENIDEIIKLSKQYEYNPPKKEEFWVGFRTKSLHIDNKELFHSVISKILSYYFPDENVRYYNSYIYFHKLTPKCKKTKGKTHYHQDHGFRIAGVVYLNNGHIENGTTIFNKKKKKQIIISNDLNTLVCYEGSKFHGPTTLNVKKERLTMNIFIKNIEIL
tara:strand:- start:172 stop:681 length:510 start_codon:yes stop_codon:yes gene_type:complete